MQTQTAVDSYQTISKYDRIRGGLKDIAMHTKPSTVQTVENFTGKAETFVVITARNEDQGGDFIFIECIDENNQVTRLALPPKVANAIASQRDSLTTRRRSQAAKRRMALMTDEQKQERNARLAKGRKHRKPGKEKQ